MVEMTVIGGRGGFVSFFFCAFLFFFFRVDFDRIHLLRLTPRTLFFVLAVCVFVLVLAAVSLMDTGALPRSLSRIATLWQQLNTSSSSNLSSSQSRPYLWHQSLDVWALHPFFGCGLGSWGLLTGGTDLAGDYAHNFLLQALSELGLVGFGLFILPIYLLIQNLLRHWRHLPKEALSLHVLLAIFSFMQAMVIGNLTDFWTYAGVGLLFMGVNFRTEAQPSG
jgi:O-antigen ligase